jgi:hypothetical protein
MIGTGFFPLLIRMPCVWLALIALATISKLPDAHGQLTQPQLRERARADIKEGYVRFSPPKISEVDGQLFWQLGDAILAGSNEAHHAVRAQYRVEVIRHTRDTERQRRFWEPTLSRVEDVIADELSYRSRIEHLDPEVIEGFIRRESSLYDSLRDSYARDRGLQVARPSGSHGVPRLPVTLIALGGGEIYLMDALDYWLLTTETNPQRTRQPLPFEPYKSGNLYRLYPGRYMYRIGRMGEIQSKVILDAGEVTFVP